MWRKKRTGWKLKNTEEPLRSKILAMAADYQRKWEARHGMACPRWARAILIERAKAKALNPQAARSQAGRKSWQVRCARDREAALLHMKLISKIGTAAIRHEAKTGRKWKDGSQETGNRLGKQARDETKRETQPMPFATANRWDMMPGKHMRPDPDLSALNENPVLVKY